MKGRGGVGVKGGEKKLLHFPPLYVGEREKKKKSSSPTFTFFLSSHFVRFPVLRETKQVIIIIPPRGSGL